MHLIQYYRLVTIHMVNKNTAGGYSIVQLEETWCAGVQPITGAVQKGWTTHRCVR